MISLKIFVFSLMLAFANSDTHEASGAHGPEHPAPVADIEEVIEDEPGTILVRESPEEVMIPSQIWDLIYTEEKNKPSVIFVPIKVQLSEKNPGVLSKEEVSVQFPRGGGEIDLSQFVTSEKRGSFFVRFLFDKKANPEKSFVYFVSRNRKRKVNGEILGSGCKSFVDIKKFLTKSEKSGGILVNTTRLRHLSVLGGTFVFANVIGKEVRLSQVTFKDTKNSKYFCASKIENKSVKSGDPNSESAESL